MHGFLSYSHTNNKNELVNEIYRQLCGNLEQLLDEKIVLYFDQENRDQGKLKDVIKEKIDKSSIFIPIISKSYCKQNSTAYHEFMYAYGLMQSRPNFLIAPLLIGEVGDIENTIIWSHIRELITFRLGIVLSKYDAPQFTPKLTQFTYALRKRITTKQEKISGIITEPLRSIRDLVNDIESSANGSNQHSAFRAKLINNILEDVVKEIQSLNKNEYAHDISLDKSFVTRAKAIFEAANEIYAVSIDTSSSFWLSESTREIAVSYTKVQPKRTFRVFVFSSPVSMLKHRWVMHAHQQCYGTDGRVLMTSLAHWKRYLAARGGDEAASRTSEDFGILSYPLKTADVLATLSRSALSFKDAEKSDFHLKVKADFKSEPTTITHHDGDTHTLNPLGNDIRTFWLWDAAYANDVDAKAWHHCVSDVFDGDIDFNPMYNSRVMHNILFAPRKNDEEFEKFMKNIIDKIIQLKSIDGEMFIKSIWFGKISKQNLENMIDPIHADPLYFDDHVLAKWRYCLTITFKSEKDLSDYYGHSDHGPIRREVYSFLDDKAKSLYTLMANSGDIKGIGEVIERLISKQMLRLDYAVPNPYMVYEAVDAPIFFRTS